MNVLLVFAFLLIWVKGDNPEERGPYFEGDLLEDPSLLSAKSGVNDLSKRWPGNTIVYEIDPNFPPTDRTTLFDAMNHITGRTCIRFKERSNEEAFIHVTNKINTCSTNIGRQGNNQTLHLGSGCYPLRTHIHELVHVIGFQHEQSRPDRDQFVTINAENVVSESVLTRNFGKSDPSSVSDFNAPYDYKSIVHYSRNAFSKEGKNTITPLDPDVEIGVIASLSEFDIKKINNMYCPGTQGIRLQNLADEQYLSVQSYSVEGRPVHTAEWTGEATQNWTTDWNALQDPMRGSTLVSWSQDGARIKVLDEDVASATVSVWGYAYGVWNQVWWLKRVPFANESRWQLVNKRTGRCILSMGRSIALTATCNVNDAKQLWKIYNV